MKRAARQLPARTSSIRARRSRSSMAIAPGRRVARTWAQCSQSRARSGLGYARPAARLRCAARPGPHRRAASDARWTTRATSSSSPRPAAPASPASSRRCWSSIRISSSRSRTPRARRAARNSTAANTTSSTSRDFRADGRGAASSSNGPRCTATCYGTSRGAIEERIAGGARRGARDRLAGRAADQAAVPQRGADLHPAAELGRAALRLERRGEDGPR